MKRREFFKASGLGAAAMAASCAPAPVKTLPMLVRDPALLLGKEEWKPGLCTSCGAGCGVIARIVSPGRAVKLEGNPAHPVAGGHLCARGQTALEALYHPDRLTTALRRGGARGSGGLSSLSTSVAVAEIAARLGEIGARNPRGIVALGRRVRGTDRALLDAWLDARGAGAMVETGVFREAGWREATRRMTGHAMLPWPDFERATLVFAFGADLVSTGPSPVAFARGIARMRDRAGAPGKLVVIGSRFSPTAAAADEWVACAPGSEGLVALGIARVLMDRGLLDQDFIATRTRGFEQHQDAVGNPRPGAGDLLRQYPLSKVEAMSGVAAATIERLAAAAAGSRPFLAIGGGAAAAHTNGVASMMAVLALDAMLGSFGEGGLWLPPPPPFAPLGPIPDPADPDACAVSFAERLAAGGPEPIEALLLVGGANPAYDQPELREALLKLKLVVAVTPILDESAVLADYVLPEAHALERWIDDVPEPMGKVPVATLGAPLLPPRGESRGLGDLLLALARAEAGAVAAALPWDSLEAALRARWEPVVGPGGLDPVVAAGVWMGASEDGVRFATAHGAFDFSPPSPEAALVGEQSMMGGMETPASETLPHHRPPRVIGSDSDFPLWLEVIQIPASGEGQEPARPGLGELRDSWTGAMWEAWAELNPRTAEALGVKHGEEIEIETPAGSQRFPLRVLAWSTPGVVAVVAGGGARVLGRFARARGGNALALAATTRVEGARARAWASSRARIRPAGRS